MTTFLSGGTGTPKLLDGLGRLDGGESVFDPEEVTVVANTGDDVELGGLLVCPDVDTVLFQQANWIDRDRWWGIAEDSTKTHDELKALADTAGLEPGPRYLSESAQTTGRPLSRWRRFSGVAEFMELGDRDRALHITRTSLLDEGRTLSEVTDTLADAMDVPVEVLPMSDDPVASIIHTPETSMHFQEFWVANRGKPDVSDVEFRGSKTAQPAPGVLEALRDEPVVIGPSNPVTSIGPMLAVEGVEEALRDSTVVAVSPFVEDRVFSGPAAKLMAAVGYDPSTAGVAAAYPFVDAFVLDDEDGTSLARPTVQTDAEMNDADDAARVLAAVEQALEVA